MSVKMDVQMTPRAMYDFLAVSHIQPSQWADWSDFWSCCTWTWNPGDGTRRLYRRYDVFTFSAAVFTCYDTSHTEVKGEGAGKDNADVPKGQSHMS